MFKKNYDNHNRWRNKTVAFQVSAEEDLQLETLVKLTGLTKQDYIIRRLLERDVVVQGNPKVYKALRDQLSAVLDELRRIEAGQGVSDELLDKVHQGTVLYLALEDDFQRIQSRMFMMYGVNDTPNLHFATASGKIGNGLDEQLKNFVQEHPDTNLIIIDTMQKIREVGGEAYSYASDYEIIGRIKQFADQHGICVLTVHHTRKQQADDSFETISGTTGLLGCADGSLLMQKKKRTELDATIKVVGRDQPDQILYLKKDPQTQIWNLERMENELYKEPPDPVLDAVAKLVSAECREWIGSPSELAEAIQTGMVSNALTKYLNVKAGRLREEYHVGYENKAKHFGRQVKLTYMLMESTAYEVTEE